MRILITSILVWLLLNISLKAQETIPVEVDSDKVEIACGTNPQLTDVLFLCAVRVKEISNPISITAVDTENDIELPTALEQGIPDTDDSSILFLVDRSNPTRQTEVTRIINDFKKIANQKGKNQAIAVLSFANDLIIHQKFTTDLPSIISALDGIKASGLSTELFRLTGDAVKILAQRDSQNKVLMLASDGKAEDIVYMAPAVLEPSLEANIRIVGLGYISSEINTPDTQILRKLAEDSNGIFLLAEANKGLKETELEGLIQRTSTTSNFLVRRVSNTKVEQANVKLEFQGSPPITFLVNIPSSISNIPAQDNNDESDVTDSFFKKAKAFLSTNTGILSSIVVGIFFLILMFLLFFRRENKSNNNSTDNAAYEPVSSSDNPEELNKNHPQVDASENIPQADKAKSNKAKSKQLKPDKPDIYAKLKFSDPEIGEVIMTKDGLQIGRHSSDDIFCPDPAVSRQHVLLSRNPKGRFQILNRQADRDVPNPIYINNKEMITAELNDGDTVRIGNGDTVFTFFTS